MGQYLRANVGPPHPRTHGEMMLGPLGALIDPPLIQVSPVTPVALAAAVSQDPRLRGALEILTAKA